MISPGKILSRWSIVTVLVLCAGPFWFSISDAADAKAPSPFEWDKTIEAAKKEGKVVVSVPASADLRRLIEKVFRQRFGIDAELNAGSAASIVGKIRQEAKANTSYFDVHMGGGE